MSGKYLLDTNIVIALFAEDLSVKKHIAKAGEIFIPAPVIGSFILVLSSPSGRRQIADSFI
jgi:predicted nucleic acid-binding protein